MDVNMMESEISGQIASSSVSCGSCECHFLEYNAFSLHHFQCPYICVCEKEILTECEYWQHFHLKADFTLFKCCVCSTSFAQQVHLLEHIVEQHADLVKYACQHCKDEFTTFGTLASHISVNGIGNHNECLTCQEVFGSKCALIKHENRSHAQTIVSASKKSAKSSTQRNKIMATDDIACRDFENAVLKMKICRTDSQNSAHDLQQHCEHKLLREYPIDFPPICADDDLQPHPEQQSQANLQSFHSAVRPQASLSHHLHPEMIHDMKYNMSYPMSDCAYRSLQHVFVLDFGQQCQNNLVRHGQANQIHPWQYNWSHPLLLSGGHYVQHGRNPYSLSLSGHLVRNGINSSQNNPRNLLQFPSVHSLPDFTIGFPMQ